MNRGDAFGCREEKNLTVQYIRGRLSTEFIISLNKKSGGRAATGMVTGMVLQVPKLSLETVSHLISVLPPSGYWSSDFRVPGLETAAQFTGFLPFIAIPGGK